MRNLLATHPDGSHKRLSSGTLDTSDTNYWDVDYSSGATEGGSSGSPLYDASKRFIGQRWGDTKQCPPNASSVYGRFNVNYPHIRRWIEIGSTIHVDCDSSGVEEGTPTKPFDTVGETHRFSWNGVRIKIAAGSYLETLTFSRELTVLAEGGTVSIGPRAVHDAVNCHREVKDEKA